MEILGLFNLFNFYGLIYSVAFLFYYLKLEKSSIRLKNTLFYLNFILSITFARIFHVLDHNNLPYYLSQPIKFFFIWEGGLSWYGGLFGFILSVIIYLIIFKLKYSKKLKKEIKNLISFYNNFVLYLPLFIFFGRLANFLNKEHLGVFNYLNPVIESLFQGFFVFLILLNSKDKISSFIIFYTTFRFITELFRGNFSLKWNHLLIILFAFFSLYFYKFLKDYSESEG